MEANFHDGLIAISVLSRDKFSAVPESFQTQANQGYFGTERNISSFTGVARSG